MSDKGTIESSNTIIGDGSMIGNDNSSNVTKLQFVNSKETISEAVSDFLAIIGDDSTIPLSDKEKAIQLAKELEVSLSTSQPDLGAVQRFRAFVKERGGPLATAGLSLLASTAVKAVVEQAVKGLLQ